MNRSDNPNMYMYIANFNLNIPPNFNLILTFVLTLTSS
jgi:hypothetical protein